MHHLLLWSRTFPLLGVLVLSVVGCGEPQKELAEEMHDIQSRVAEILKKIDSVEDAIDAGPTIESLSARWNLLAVAAKGLESPSEAEKTSLESEVGKLAEQLRAIKDERDRLREHEDQEIWAVLEAPLQKYDAAMALPTEEKEFHSIEHSHEHSHQPGEGEGPAGG